MSKYNVNDQESLSSLEKHLTQHIFVGGAHPTGDDAAVFNDFQANPPTVEQHPHVFSWYCLINVYSENTRKHWVEEQEKKQKQGKGHEKKGKHHEEKPKEEAAPAKAEEVDDMFGDEEENEEEAAKRAAAKKAKKDAAKKDKKKNEPVQKSIVLLDIKPWEKGQDLDSLAAKVIKIEKDGLFWKTEYKLSEIAFGIFKLTIGLVVEDEKVSVDDVCEWIQTGFEDEVQSVDIVSFNKI